mmetsp:Transcript_5746/g.18459  ORF Transcript_5746/g.18459 Transcript_5746/m.18459 type:complete len:263 (-) Transcript_5746:669-1457(-)
MKGGNCWIRTRDRLQILVACSHPDHGGQLDLGLFTLAPLKPPHCPLRKQSLLHVLSAEALALLAAGVGEGIHGHEAHEEEGERVGLDLLQAHGNLRLVRRCLWCIHSPPKISNAAEGQDSAHYAGRGDVDERSAANSSYYADAHKHMHSRVASEEPRRARAPRDGKTRRYESCGDTPPRPPGPRAGGGRQDVLVGRTGVEEERGDADDQAGDAKERLHDEPRLARRNTSAASPSDDEPAQNQEVSAHGPQRAGQHGGRGPEE